MDFRIPVAALLCAAAIILAGCMSPNPGPVTPVPTNTIPATVTTAPATSVPPATVQTPECTGPADCIPAECCHPAACIAGPRKTPCSVMCTMVCSGPLDCGAGSCGCVRGRCTVVPALQPSLYREPSVTLRASPSRYSPVMSSTPGIRLEPEVAGFDPAEAVFAWNASFGRFLSWNATDFRVDELGDTVTNHGEEIYWSFLDQPASTAVPVTIRVTATDTKTGKNLASADITLAWDGNSTVVVKQ